MYNYLKDDKKSKRYEKAKNKIEKLLKLSRIKLTWKWNGLLRKK